MKKIEKSYLEGLYEELAFESIEEKEEVVSLEKFGKYAYTKTARERALELELEILEMKRGELF